MDVNVYDIFQSGQSTVSSTNLSYYKDYLVNLAKQTYESNMAVFKESVHELVKPQSKMVEQKPCSSDKESEIFSSQSDIDEQSCIAKCPSFEGMDILNEKKPFNEWWEYFTGFHISRLNLDFDILENRKCVELSLQDKYLNIEMHLRKGVRCFLIDLFVGTEVENLNLIYKLKEAEIRLTREFNFPVISTLIAKLSPRHQYTGYMDPPNTVHQLNLRDPLILSVDRHWSTRGSVQTVYVNARNLIDTLKVCDVLAVGNSLQLTVRAIDDTNIYTVVSRPGELRSHMCVLFPQQCERYRVSWEEVESITFSSVVGISVVASYIDGTPAYAENLKKVLELLEAGHMRLYARIVMNEIKGCNYDMGWVVDTYDGFIVDTKPKTYSSKPELLHVCPNATCLMDDMFIKGKPILFENYHIARRKLIPFEENYIHIFLYPDKYIVKSDNVSDFFFFNFLAERYLKAYNIKELSKQRYCDFSYTGIDTLARAIVALSYEIRAKAIIVTSQYGVIASKIAKYRPWVPIILVSRTRELVEYVMVHYNLILVYIPTKEKQNYKKLALKELFYGLMFLLKMKIITEDDYIVLVYSMKRGLKFQDKYFKYQYKELTYKQDLKKNLFD